MRNSFILLFCSLYSVLGFSQSKDAALWTGFEMDKAIVKKWRGHVKFQGRLNDNFTHADYGFVDLGLTYKHNKYIQFTSAYVLNTKNSRVGNNWRLRQQWYGNVRFNYKNDFLKFSNRNQLQTDLEDSRSSAGSWFYRNKTMFKFPLRDDLDLYCSYEMYLRLGARPQFEKPIYRNRYSAGFSYSFSKQSSIDLGYLIQQQIRRGDLDFIYAVTIGFNYSFDGKMFGKSKKKKK